MVQNASAVGAQLNARAGFTEFSGLLENGNLEAGLGKAKRGSQPTDAAAGDEYPAAIHLCRPAPWSWTRWPLRTCVGGSMA